MNSAATIMNSTLDQLLRAAQLIEQTRQQNIAAAVAAEPAKIFATFGTDYEERETVAKIRAALCLNNAIQAAPSSSQGSSVRSSPISMMSLSTVSSPNSPSNNTNNNYVGKSGARSSSGSTVSASTRQSRAAHNELEKNRRANLRSYLEKLKSVLPADHDSTRDTTLSLLTRARNYLRAIHEQKQHLASRRTELLAEQLQLVELVEKARQQLDERGHQQQEAQQQQQLVEDERFSPSGYLEYSPSAKPIDSPDTPTTITIDLYMEGLMPLMPALYPYTYLGNNVY